jgi:hypothetical protein
VDIGIEARLFSLHGIFPVKSDDKIEVKVEQSRGAIVVVKIQPAKQFLTGRELMTSSGLGAACLRTAFAGLGTLFAMCVGVFYTFSCT